MTDTEALKSVIKQSGYRINYIAKRIGITYQSLLNKLRNECEFKASEILVLCELLSIDTKEKERIFFAK